MTDNQLEQLKRLQSLKRKEKRHEIAFWDEVDAREKEVIDHINANVKNRREAEQTEDISDITIK